MRALAVTSSVSAATAQWIEAIRAAGHDLEVFDAERSQWVRRTSATPVRAVPGWLDAHALRSAGNAVAGFYRKLIDSDYYDAVVGFGLAAGGVLGRFSPVPFSSVLFTGQLDFPADRASSTEDFAALTRGAEVLFLENAGEFDKATSKGSRSIRRLHPAVPVADGGPVIEAPESAKRIALLHPERMDVERVAEWRSEFAAVVEAAGGELETRSISSLYRHRDAAARRRLVPTMRTRLSGFSHAIVVGSSLDHRAVLDTLVATGAGHRVIAEQTAADSPQAAERPRAACARGGDLVDLATQLLSGGVSPVDAAPADHAGDTAAVRDPLAALVTAEESVR